MLEAHEKYSTPPRANLFVIVKHICVYICWISAERDCGDDCATFEKDGEAVRELGTLRPSRLFSSVVNYICIPGVSSISSISPVISSMSIPI